MNAIANDPRELAQWLHDRLKPGAQLTADSRAVRAGDAFLAFPGKRSDGRQYIAQALLNGAGAVLWQQESFNWPFLDEAPQRAISELRTIAGAVASSYYGEPSAALDLIAVTGTNGKTTCTQWLADGYQRAGAGAAVVGTLGCGLVGDLKPFGLTTPDAISLQAMLARFRAQAVTKVALEASSNGLDQGRLDGARVIAAVFTNLTHDHLDYHGSMQAYAQAKALLFAREHLRAVVVNGDDPASAQMLNAYQQGASAGNARRIAYRCDPTRTQLPVDAQLLAETITLRADGQSLQLAGDFGRASLELSLLGRFNASNVLAVMATWLALDMSFTQACDLARQLVPVRGRMEIVATQPLIVVDYAHTPDALENALRTLKPVAEARAGALWCVFGAGGDRDPSKRPIMGGIAEQFAHHVVVTSDNPRGESPIKIIADIRAGLTREPALTEVDRGLAITRALRQAQPNDVVLIAGKGHEDYQEIGANRLPFSDVAVARAGLQARAEFHHA